MGRTGPAAPAGVDRVGLWPESAAGLLRTHHAASRLRQRELSRGCAPDARGRPDLPRQVRRARRGAGRGFGARRVAGDARAEPEPVLALAPRQCGQSVLLRRVRRLHQAGEVEGVLVRAGWLRADRLVRGPLRVPATHAGGCGMNATSAPFLVPVVLEGRHVRLEPMESAHAPALATAAADGELWKLW